MIQNTGKLAGRTFFITGASRGIGKAIALKAARDGANIVVAAKTAEPHPKLPGTIYTAAKEIESAGGKALSCVVDVRNESSVEDAVKQTVDKFGGIDCVVNNASAIALTGTQQLEMKRFDLMHQINTRGTFLVSKLCIPHLMKSSNPHILNISPPLNMNAFWFKDHVAYTMAKYGMSMCVLGMAEELKPLGIAVNALWPRTAIQTAAMEMLGGKDITLKCRKPEIMADAAYTIVSRDAKSYTGNFTIDDNILKEEGVTDFTQYAVDPSKELLPDFFLDEYHEWAMKNLEQSKEASASKPAASSSGLGQVFDRVQAMIDSEVISSTKAIYVFDVSGEDGGKWYIDLKDKGVCGQGEPPSKADATFTLDSTNFTKMFSGTLKPTTAFMTGKLKIAGDMGKALKLEKLMSRMQSKL